MKIQNLLLSTLFAFQYVNATTEKIFNYKFHCLNNYKNSCSTLHKELVDATNSLSDILGKNTDLLNYTNLYFNKYIALFFSQCCSISNFFIIIIIY